ncbi:MAG TPA: cytochrome oxidase subunit III [Myxococcales bacterium]|nr:cytochrome oxidase subunit III [Myxococcales bacterium]
MGDVKRTDEIQGEIIHVYDGIEEADNALPMWWLWTFYGAIAFAIGYWFVYEEFEMASSTPELFAEAMAARAAAGDVDAETLQVLAGDAATVAEGRETFQTTCAACHGAEGQGQIGPNLTDDAWLHGGGPLQIYGSILDGISSDRARLAGSSGMPEWGAALGQRRVQAVTAYLLTVRNTNVQGGRPAEGEPFDPNASPEEREAETPEEAPGESEHAVTGDEAPPGA